MFYLILVKFQESDLIIEYQGFKIVFQSLGKCFSFVFYVFYLVGCRNLNNKVFGIINKFDDLNVYCDFCCYGRFESVGCFFVKVLKLRENVCLLSVFVLGGGFQFYNV